MRALSFAAAGFVSLVLLVDPYVLGGIPLGWVHAGLPLMMLGVTGLFMHGVGFELHGKILRLMLGPVAAWLLFAAGALVLADVM